MQREATPGVIKALHTSFREKRCKEKPQTSGPLPANPPPPKPPLSHDAKASQKSSNPWVAEPWTPFSFRGAPGLSAPNSFRSNRGSEGKIGVYSESKRWDQQTANCRDEGRSSKLRIPFWGCLGYQGGLKLEGYKREGFCIQATILLVFSNSRKRGSKRDWCRRYGNGCGSIPRLRILIVARIWGVQKLWVKWGSFTPASLGIRMPSVWTARV